MAKISTTGWRAATDMRFAAPLEAIALAVTEVPFVAQSAPVAFMQSPAGWRAMAIFAPADGRNRFVTEDGNWRGHYVPSLLRAYPFMLSDTGGTRKLTLWPMAQQDSMEDGGAPFLVDGLPSEQVQKTLSFLIAAHADIAQADDALRVLHEAGVLVPWCLPGLAQALHLGGQPVHVADPDRLAALPGALVLKLHKIQALPWIYAHLHSLHFARLFNTGAETPWSEMREPLARHPAGSKHREDTLNVVHALTRDLGDIEL